MACRCSFGLFVLVWWAVFLVFVKVCRVKNLRGLEEEGEGMMKRSRCMLKRNEKRGKGFFLYWHCFYMFASFFYLFFFFKFSTGRAVADW